MSEEDVPPVTAVMIGYRSPTRRSRLPMVMAFCPQAVCRVSGAIARWDRPVVPPDARLGGSSRPIRRFALPRYHLNVNVQTERSRTKSSLLPRAPKLGLRSISGPPSHVEFGSNSEAQRVSKKDT